jgi:hypothetical protein
MVEWVMLYKNIKSGLKEVIARDRTITPVAI